MGKEFTHTIYGQNMNDRSLTRYAWLSIVAAIVTMGLKAAGYWLTGSIGLLSDAIESIVNLVGGIMALGMLTIAARPADDDHAFGHSKAEYFSSGVEGTLILVAAISIAITAVERILSPKALEQVGMGLGVSVAASLINLAVALVLLRVARKNRSITLEANAQHLLTDVWTSAGVLTGVVLVVMTGWNRLDPVVALLVAVNIVWTGISIVRRSVQGLMDKSLPEKEQKVIKEILSKYEAQEIQFHDLRTRQAGAHSFVSMHVLTPGVWTVRKGHEVVDCLENELAAALPNLSVSTHLEPLEDADANQP
jgi:cation diffusion facilitator family transporter